MDWRFKRTAVLRPRCRKRMESKSMSNTEKWDGFYQAAELLGQMVFLAGLISGILFFGAEELNLPFQAGPLVGAIALASAAAVFLCRLPAPGGLLMLLGALGTGFSLWAWWEPVSIGARAAVSSWIELFNSYFHQWKAGPDMSELAGMTEAAKRLLLAESSQTFLVILAVLLLFWSAFFLIRLGSLVLPHTLMALELFFILTVGVVPKSYGVLWYGVLLLLWICGGGSRGLQKRGKFCRWRWSRPSLSAAAFSSLAMGLAFLLCAGLLMPRMESVLADGSSGMKTWIRARLEEAADWDALFGNSARTGGVNGGDLSRQGDRMESGSVALSVTVDEVPENVLYLKAYVGSDYEGNSWEALPSGLLEDETGLSAETVWAFPVELLKARGASFRNMTVELYDAANQYLYAPYGAVLPEEIRYVGDQYLRRWSSREDSYSYSPEFLSFSGGVETETKAEEAYGEYVRNHYLSAPDSKVWEPWKSSKDRGAPLPDLIGAVQDYLGDQAVYTLTPGNLPEEEDFIEYFLFQNKKGYCTHFASAATVLFRLWDIPARYVEGYMVSPDEFHDNGDGTWTAWVTDGSAHAWTEIYQEGGIWFPVEATPPYWNPENLFSSGSEPEAPEEEPETEAVVSESKEEPETEASALPEQEKETQAEEPEEQKRISPEFPWLLFGAGAAVLLAAGGTVGWKRSKRNKRQMRMRDPNRRLALLALGEEAERLLFGDAQSGALLDFDFAEQAAEKTEGIGREEWEEFSHLVKRARFSPHPVEEEEYRKVRDFYWKAQEHLKKPCNGWTRFWREIPKEDPAQHR